MQNVFADKEAQRCASRYRTRCSGQKNENRTLNSAHHACGKKGFAYDPKRTIPTVRQEGGSIIRQGCFSANGTGALHAISGNIDGAMNWKISEGNLIALTKKLNLGTRWMFQHDNDPKHN